MLAERRRRQLGTFGRIHGAAALSDAWAALKAEPTRSTGSFEVQPQLDGIDAYAAATADETLGEPLRRRLGSMLEQERGHREWIRKWLVDNEWA